MPRTCYALLTSVTKKMLKHWSYIPTVTIYQTESSGFADAVRTSALHPFE